MNKKSIILVVIAIGFFIYSVWSIIDWIQNRRNKTWSDEQIEFMIDICISSSNYFSSLDSVIANDICSCATYKLIDNYTYDEIWELEKRDQESLIELMSPIVKECMFPVAFEDKHAIIDSNMITGYDSIVTWIPKYDDYRLAESILLSAIKRKRNKEWNILSEESLSDYYRQYLFYKDESGDSIVFINAFCEIPNTYENYGNKYIEVPYDWKHNIVSIMDGGDCYWQIWINISKKTYRDFWVNGHA